MLLLPTANSPRFRFTLRSDLLGPHVLRTDPLGWDQLGVSLVRDPKAHGLGIEYTVQVGFVQDGRAYVSRAYAAAGVEADVRLGVEQLDPNAFSWEPYYAGRVNLTSAEFSRLQVKANVENEDFTQKFLNRASNVIDLLGTLSVGGSSGPAAPLTTVQLHSRTLVKKFDGAVLPTAQPLPFGPGLVLDDASRSQTFYFGYSTITSNEIGLQQIAGGFVSGDAYSAVPIFPVPDTGQYVVELGGAVDIKVRLTSGPNGIQGLFNDVDVKFHYRINGDPSTATVLASHSGHAGEGGMISIYTRRFTIAPQQFVELLSPTDKIYLYAEVYVHDITESNGMYLFNVFADVQPGTYLRITAQTKTAPTPCTGVLLYEALERVCQALTDEVDCFRSDYFGRTDTRIRQPVDGPGALRMVTGGFQLRGFPLPSEPGPNPDQVDARKSIYTSWEELFGSAEATDALGWGVERSAAGKPVIRVEPAAYWYPDRVALDLTVATPERPAPTAEVTTKVRKERLYQQVEMGYASWQAEQVNGLDEANSTRQWTTPLTQVATVYAKVSKIAASGQLLEVTRRQRFVNSDTTDNRTDNRNFFVCLLRAAVVGGYETERNQRFPLLTGILDPDSIYNARLSPARNLRRHGPQLVAGLLPGSLVRFAFGEGNNHQVSQQVGELAPLDEGADVPVETLGPALWRAESDTFPLPVTREQLRQLLADPCGRVRYFDDAGAVREGWVLDCKHDAVKETADFDLLPCADRE